MEESDKIDNINFGNSEYIGDAIEALELALSSLERVIDGEYIYMLSIKTIEKNISSHINYLSGVRGNIKERLRG